MIKVLRALLIFAIYPTRIFWGKFEYEMLRKGLKLKLYEKYNELVTDGS